MFRFKDQKLVTVPMSLFLDCRTFWCEHFDNFYTKDDILLLPTMYLPSSWYLAYALATYYFTFIYATIIDSIIGSVKTRNVKEDVYVRQNSIFLGFHCFYGGIKNLNWKFILIEITYYAEMYAHEKLHRWIIPSIIFNKCL